MARDTRQLVEAAMTETASFMELGAKLQTAGVKYAFTTEAPMPPAYIIVIAGRTWFVVNEKYADDGSFTVNGLGLTQ